MRKSLKVRDTKARKKEGVREEEEDSEWQEYERQEEGGSRK